MSRPPSVALGAATSTKKRSDSLREEAEGLGQIFPSGQNYGRLGHCCFTEANLGGLLQLLLIHSTGHVQSDHSNKVEDGEDALSKLPDADAQ